MLIFVFPLESCRMYVEYDSLDNSFSNKHSKQITYPLHPGIFLAQAKISSWSKTYSDSFKYRYNYMYVHYLYS